MKLPAYRNYGYAVYDCSSCGPTFGGHDIYIANYTSSNSNSYTYLGHVYSLPSGYSYESTSTLTFLAGTYQFTPDEVETFYETTDAKSVDAKAYENRYKKIKTIICHV